MASERSAIGPLQRLDGTTTDMLLWYVQVRFGGRDADLDWRFAGPPNGERDADALRRLVWRQSSVAAADADDDDDDVTPMHHYRYLLHIAEATAADVGRYEFRVQLHDDGNSSACPVSVVSREF